MKLLIVGAGGVGGYFGARLMQAGGEITFLLREKRQKLIAEMGLVIETPGEKFTVYPDTVTKETVTPDYDLIILAPKAYDLEDSLKSIEKASTHGILLPFLNGMDQMEVLDKRFGRERVMGGVAQIAATIAQNGAVQQLRPGAGLVVGARSAAQTRLLGEFSALATAADFNYVESPDIEQALWDKWVMLATLAGMTTLCLGTVGEIVATPYGAELSARMHAECCAIAAANGHEIADKTADAQRTLLTNRDSNFAASMMRDLVGGLRTEHEHILAALIRRGRAGGIDCPLLKIAYTHMAVVQDR
jgi:2-dehydropantoate 2-reductase